MANSAGTDELRVFRLICMMAYCVARWVCAETYYKFMYGAVWFPARAGAHAARLRRHHDLHGRAVNFLF